jgi:nucleotide-binding universal stress UspA family protein
VIALKKVLVATDFGPAAAAALGHGRTLAHTFDGELHVLHVVDDLFAFRVISRDEQQDLELLARGRTEALIHDEDRRELHACAVTSTSTDPAQAIVEYARLRAIDLIVVGTHGRGPIGHLIDGNVAERVVRTAPCPVLTVHNPEREFVLPDQLVTVTRR